MEFLFIEWLIKPVWMWLAFIGIVIVLLVLDLGVLHREQREIREVRIGGAAGLHRLQYPRCRPTRHRQVPPPASLGITFAILAAGIGWSLYKTRACSPGVRVHNP